MRKERSATVVDPLGSYCDLQPVHMRDLRQLDESFNASNETSIVVRKQAILINADPIRSIITRNSTLVFVPDGADSLLLMLIKDFDECVHKQSDAPTAYEFKCVLDTVVLNDVCLKN
jgi:magnesium transporter